MKWVRALFVNAKGEEVSRGERTFIYGSSIFAIFTGTAFGILAFMMTAQGLGALLLTLGIVANPIGLLIFAAVIGVASVMAYAAIFYVTAASLLKKGLLKKAWMHIQDNFKYTGGSRLKWAAKVVGHSLTIFIATSFALIITIAAASLLFFNAHGFAISTAKLSQTVAVAIASACVVSYIVIVGTYNMVKNQQFFQLIEHSIISLSKSVRNKISNPSKTINNFIGNLTKRAKNITTGIVSLLTTNPVTTWKNVWGKNPVARMKTFIAVSLMCTLYPSTVPNGIGNGQGAGKGASLLGLNSVAHNVAITAGTINSISQNFIAAREHANGILPGKDLLGKHKYVAIRHLKDAVGVLQNNSATPSELNRAMRLLIKSTKLLELSKTQDTRDIKIMLRRTLVELKNHTNEPSYNNTKAVNTAWNKLFPSTLTQIKQPVINKAPVDKQEACTSVIASPMCFWPAKQKTSWEQVAQMAQTGKTIKVA